MICWGIGEGLVGGRVADGFFAKEAPVVHDRDPGHVGLAVTSEEVHQEV